VSTKLPVRRTASDACYGTPPMATLIEIAAVARRAALAGGEVVRAARPRAPAESKGAGDYVTEVDRASERAIRAVLQGGLPEVPVVGEEGGGRAGPRHWLVDPLDGTTNFIHGFPLVGVSVALVEERVPVIGVVHAPFLGDLWAAARGSGATVERSDGTIERLHVSEGSVDRAVVGTGFPFRRKELLPRYLTAMTAGLERFEDLRRPGAAALDLAWVAAGVFDGFFELGLAPWDVAAGGLLVEEAGGVVTDWSGGRNYLAGDILAGPPAIHAELIALAAAS
jgi:myo-inositol-1(or 4)-monophosphatase